MTYAEAVLFTLLIISLLLSTGIYVFLWFEYQERTRFKTEARALIESHNHLMLKLNDVDKVAKEAQIGVNYLKSITPNPRGGQRP